MKMTSLQCDPSRKSDWRSQLGVVSKSQNSQMPRYTQQSVSLFEKKKVIRFSLGTRDFLTLILEGSEPRGS